LKDSTGWSKTVRFRKRSFLLTAPASEGLPVKMAGIIRACPKCLAHRLPLLAPRIRFHVHPLEILRQSAGDREGYYFGDFIAVQFFYPFLQHLEL